MSANPSWAGLMPVPVRYFSTGENRIAWYEKGAGPPIICLHGNPSWSVLFRPLFQGLSDRFRILSMDQAGCGQSDAPPLDYQWDLRTRIADFGAWIDHVCPDQPVTLVAHDWGGMIATSWAVDHPDRVAAMVLMNTAAFPMPVGKKLPRSIAWCRNPLVGKMLVSGLNGFLLGAVKWCTSKPLSAQAKAAYLGPHGTWEKRRSIYEFVKDIPLKVGDHSWSRLIETENKLSLLADKPILFPWGMKDFVFDGDYLREWQKRFPRAKSIAHPLLGHWLLEEEPDRIIEEIRSFLLNSLTRKNPIHEVRG